MCGRNPRCLVQPWILYSRGNTIFPALSSFSCLFLHKCWTQQFHSAHLIWEGTSHTLVISVRLQYRYWADKAKRDYHSRQCKYEEPESTFTEGYTCIRPKFAKVFSCDILTIKNPDRHPTLPKSGSWVEHLYGIRMAQLSCKNSSNCSGQMA